MPIAAPGLIGRRELVLALVLGAIGLLAWWLYQDAGPRAPAPGPGERRPDYIVDGVRAVTMDAAGRPERRLAAKQVRHFPDDGASELDAPRLIAYSDDGTPPWEVEADTGWITADADELLLEHNVVLERAAGPDSPPVRLTTSELLVLPETEYAETARYAEIESGADWITAVDGMRVWYGDAMRAKLFGRVRGRFEMEGRGDEPAAPAP